MNQWLKLNRIFYRSFITLLLLMLFGCSSIYTDKTTLRNKHLESLTKSGYKKYKEEIVLHQKKRINTNNKTIIRLEINGKDKPIKQRYLSVNLKNALLSNVIKQLNLNYHLQQTKLFGKVTASFENTPLAIALNRLLKQSNLQAVIDNERVIIKKINWSDNNNTFYEFKLRFADADFAHKMLKTVFNANNSDDDDDSDEDSDQNDNKDEDEDEDEDNDEARNTEKPIIAEKLSFLMRKNTNSIYLHGDKKQVNKAIRLLRQVDNEPQRILIEARVVEFSTEALISTGSKLSGQNGGLSNASIDFANLLGETINFTMSADEALSKVFTASINILLSNNQAKIISKPYLVTVSGKKAKIEITEDRFITSRVNGETTTEKVSSGILFDITPIASQFDGKIQLDINITSSTFLDSTSLSKKRSTVKSSSLVYSGETIIIGGLLFDQLSRDASGIPGLRDIPGIGVLFGNRNEARSRIQSIIYITPHLWNPEQQQIPLSIQH